jgi:uncharacterized protein YjbI with pentapeptide repeats
MSLEGSDALQNGFGPRGRGGGLQGLLKGRADESPPEEMQNPGPRSATPCRNSQLFGSSVLLCVMSSTNAQSAAELLTAYADGRRDFCGWSISGGVLLKETLEGCAFDGARFNECAGAFSAFISCSLERVEFTHCVFNGVDFLSSSLDGCSFTRCVLDRGDYYMSTLRGSRIVDCSMRRSCFLRANLSDCNIGASDLSGSMFGRTTLSASMLLGPALEDSIVALPHAISAAELQQLRAYAYGLSALSWDTNEPPVPTDPNAPTETIHLHPKVVRAMCVLIPGIIDFLERGGVRSDQLGPLKNVVDLTTSRSPPSVFVSYATEDESFAQGLAKTLAGSGLEIWFAPRSMRGGQKLYDQLMREIDRRDRLVLVVSKAALTSNWVKTELRRALKPSDHLRDRRVVPVLLIEEDEWRSWTLVDPDSGRDLALELRAGPAYSFTGPSLQEDRVASTVSALLQELVGGPPTSQQECRVVP